LAARARGGGFGRLPTTASTEAGGETLDLALVPAWEQTKERHHAGMAFGPPPTLSDSEVSYGRPRLETGAGHDPVSAQQGLNSFLISLLCLFLLSLLSTLLAYGLKKHLMAHAGGIEHPCIRRHCGLVENAVALGGRGQLQLPSIIALTF
jgi:hypothetical protein